MDVYIEIHISNYYIERNTNENIWRDWEFQPGTPASQVRLSTTELISMALLGKTTTFLPKCSPCQDLLILTNNAWSKMVTAPSLTEKRGNIEVNNFT